MNGSDAEKGSKTFYTSGTSGQPTRWIRTAQQMDLEIDLIESLIHHRNFDAIVCFAHQETLYGYLWGKSLACRRKCNLIYAHPADINVLLSFDKTSSILIIAIPSVIELMRRSASKMDLQAITLVHSSAMLPRGAEIIKDSFDDCRFIEVLGSTEAGLFGYRWLGEGSTDWSFSSDVGCVSPKPGAMEGELVISSPRIARSALHCPLAQWRSGDLVIVHNDLKFTHVGRLSRIVKINGRRVNLDWIEGQLQERLPHLRIITKPCRDRIRGEGYCLSYEGGGPQELNDSSVWKMITEYLAPADWPISVHRTEIIARSALGKPILAQSTDSPKLLANGDWP